MQWSKVFKLDENNSQKRFLVCINAVNKNELDEGLTNEYLHKVPTGFSFDSYDEVRCTGEKW